MSSRIVSIITQIMVMAVVLSVVLLFIGIGILLLIHLCIVGRAFGRTVNGNGDGGGSGRRRRPQEEEEAETAAVTGENHRIGFGPATTTRHTHGGGMSAEEVQKLPLFEYKNGDMNAVLDHHGTRNDKGTVGSCGDGDGGGAGFDCCWWCECECAVCLDGFQFGQKCRLLPVCGHTFHSTCVDAWLLKNPVCPICRTRAEQPQENGFCSGSSQLISRFPGDSASASASTLLLESVAVNVCDVDFT